MNCGGREDKPPLLPGHCGHTARCANIDPPDERDPFGCCNCGTRERERQKEERRAGIKRATDIMDATGTS